MYGCPRSVACALAVSLLAATMSISATDHSEAADYRADASEFAELVNRRYAYLERFPDSRFVLTAALATEASNVHDGDSLLRFLERATALLVDHHAITGAAHGNSWALVPSYSDLWVLEDADGYVVTDVRQAMPVSGRVAPGDRVLEVEGVPIDVAIHSWWRDLGVNAPSREAREFAARVLLAGRRDRDRRLTIRHGANPPLTLALPNVYAARRSLGAQPLVSSTRSAHRTRIVLNDSLGDAATMASFDAAMAAVPAGDSIVVDLTETASGGTSTVARAILGWFVAEPRPYQMHASPEELRETGIARQWAEYVAPREGKYFAGPVSVRVGRWTGSMGEGLAVGFAALGVPVCGTAMAGLLGAIDDNRLEHSGLVVKFPTERLAAMDGTPRELFRPLRPDDLACL